MDLFRTARKVLIDMLPGASRGQLVLKMPHPVAELFPLVGDIGVTGTFYLLLEFLEAVLDPDDLLCNRLCVHGTPPVDLVARNDSSDGEVPAGEHPQTPCDWSLTGPLQRCERPTPAPEPRVSQYDCLQVV